MSRVLIVPHYTFDDAPPRIVVIGAKAGVHSASEDKPRWVSLAFQGEFRPQAQRRTALEHETAPGPPPC